MGIVPESESGDSSPSPEEGDSSLLDEAKNLDISTEKRRQSELSAVGEGENLIGKSSDDSGASADSTNHLLETSRTAAI